MEPMGSISRPSKDPEVNIETWFNTARLEMFAMTFERVPSLWQSQHIDYDGVDLKTADYMQLLDFLGEPCTGEPRARVACAKSLCRVFCRLLRLKLRWAVTKSLLDGTGEEKALEMLPFWARQAERYMRYLPLIYLNTEEELKTKAERAARTQSNKERKGQELKSSTQATSNLTALYSRDSFSKKKNTNKQQAKTIKPSTASQESSSNSAKNKGSRPIPALVPLSAPAPKPSAQYSAGRHLMQRVVCGMRRAAKIYGLGRKAASVVAKEIGNQEQQVHALWSSMRVLAKAKLAALLARGDGRARSESAHLSCLDWAVVDLMMMYDYSPVQESSFHEYKQQLALLATFHLVQRFALEEARVPPQRWHEAARWYCKTGVVMSPVGLQRRWHEMKQATRRKLRAHLGGDKSAPIQPLHRAIANRYPHVVTGRLTPWSELLAADLVARPTNERGSTKSRQRTATNDESTDSENLERNALLGDRAKASGEKLPVLSVRPGTSKSMAVIDNAPAHATSGSEVSNDCIGEEKSDHIHRNEAKNKHYENIRGASYKKNMDGNKEVIVLDAQSAEFDKLDKRQAINDRNGFNIDIEEVREEDCEYNIDDNKEITDLDTPSAKPDELEKRHTMDDRNVFKIDTEEVKKADYKNNIDDNKEIIDLDTPSAKPDELEKRQEMDNRNVFNKDTEEVKEENCKNNIDDSKEIIDLDTLSAKPDELKKRQGMDDRNTVNKDNKTVRGVNNKKNIDINKDIIDSGAPSAKADVFINRQRVVVKDVVDGRITCKANNESRQDFATQAIRAIEKELFYDRGINHSSDCNDSNGVHTNEKIRHNENAKGQGYQKNIDVNKQIIDLDAPSAESHELKRRQGIGDINGFNIIQKIVEDKIASKTNVLEDKKASKANAPNSDDFATQVIRAIEKDIFYNRSSKLSKNNECNTAQNCANVSNSKTQLSSIEKKYDGIEKVTSSSQMETDDSNSNVTDATNKHPMLSQMLQTVSIFDDDAELTAFLNKNKKVYQKGNSSNTDVTTDTNIHTHEIKSSVEIRNRKRMRAKITDDWAQGIVMAIKKQRLESAKFENPQICNLINEETSRDGVDDIKKYESHGSASDKLKKTSSSDLDDSKSVINLDSGDEVYKGSDDEDTSQDSEIALDSVDPKLLMYPVVVMTRFENDPSLRIIPNPSSLPTCRSPSPSLSNIKLESPSLSDIKLEKLDDRDACHGDTPFSANEPTSESLHEKTRALLKLCKPCVVLLERLEDVDKGLGRLAKRVELQDIDEVRRTNRRVLTAQVAPLAQDSEPSSTDSCDSDWTPETDETRKPPTNENSDSTSDSDYEPLKPAKAKNLKNPNDDLKQLLNDFVDSPADAECCRRSKKTGMRGDLKTTAALAMKRGCARCLWQMLSLPPTSAQEAQLQRRLLRHTVLQATSTASTFTEIPKQKPSGTKQLPKQIASRQSEKRPLPASPASHSDNAATLKQNQRISCAVASPLPEPGRIHAGMKIRLEPRGPPTLPKNPTRRGSEPVFRPEVDINKIIGKPSKDKPLAPAPAPGGFDPIITSVLSLAPPQSSKIHNPPEMIKLLQRKLAPAGPNVTKKPQAPPKKPQVPPKNPQANVRQAEPVAIPVNVPGSSPNYVPIPSNGAQPQINILQPHNVAQNQNSQFDRDPIQSVNMLNCLQAQTQHETPQYLPGTTHWPPVQTVKQMGSQNFALPEIGNVMIHPNTLAGNVIDTQGLQNAPWNNQGNLAVKQETSAFQPVLRVNTNQLDPMHINPNQPNPMYIQPNQPNPMCIQSNQANPMYIQPNQHIPMHTNQNQPNPMHVNQNQPNPVYIQPNQPNQMYTTTMYPNQPNPISFNPNQANQMYVNPNQPNPMYINSNQPTPIYPNQIYINQNQPNPMHMHPNQPNSLYTTPVHINQNQSNPMYINQNQLNLINSSQNQPISICPSTMPIKTEPASSYIPPMSHPNPYGTDAGYSSTVPMLENSTPTGLSKINSFSPMNAGTLQTLFNSTQESQSFQRIQSTYDEAVSVLAGSQQESIQVYEQAGSSQVNALQPTYAVEFKIGYCSPGSELYTKLNSYARLKRYTESAVASHEWVVGRDPSSLAVLCTGAYRHPWALLGQFLVLSQEETPPPNFDVWALNPRVRLLLPHEASNQTGDCDATPSRLKVKAFAKVGQSEAEITREWKTGKNPRQLAYAKVKLSENPVVYAKLLVSVSSANACRFLLKRGGAIQLYCIQSCQLYPIHAKPTGPDSQYSLTGESALLPALRELARQLQGDDP